MHRDHTITLYRELLAIGPAQFDYSNPVDAECGCVAVHACRVFTEKPAENEYGRDVLARVLGISDTESRKLYVGSLSDFTCYSDDKGDRVKQLDRARRCLREIAARHGIDLSGVTVEAPAAQLEVPDAPGDGKAVPSSQPSAERVAAFLAGLHKDAVEVVS